MPPPPQISWAGLGSTIPISPPPVAEETPASNENIKSEDTNKVDQETTGSHEGDDYPTTWHDVCLSIAAELMGKAREDVRVNLGYSTSAVSCLRSDSVTLTMFDIDRVSQGTSSLPRFVSDGIAFNLLINFVLSAYSFL